MARDTRDTMQPIAFIRKQLEEAEPDLLRELVHDVVDRIMASEVDGLAGARHGERTAERVNCPNGYRGRPSTRASGRSIS